MIVSRPHWLEEWRSMEMFVAAVWSGGFIASEPRLTASVCSTEKIYRPTAIINEHHD